MQLCVKNSLKSAEATTGFPLVLLKVISNDAVEPSVRQSGSVFFKNFIGRSWEYDVNRDERDLVSATDRLTIKQHIVQLMVTSPPAIQKQLSESMRVISACDFYKKWDTLLPELIQQLDTST
jgi:exportin-2 (importin alpha re-exporter)